MAKNENDVSTVAIKAYLYIDDQSARNPTKVATNQERKYLITKKNLAKKLSFKASAIEKSKAKTRVYKYPLIYILLIIYT